jgi:hypothetical protein
MHSEPSTPEALGLFVQKVTLTLGPKIGATCAVDCLLQWADGGPLLLMKTIKAWQRHLDEVVEGRPHVDTERHGSWVPAIPM